MIRFTIYRHTLYVAPKPIEIIASRKQQNESESHVSLNYRHFSIPLNHTLTMHQSNARSRNHWTVGEILQKYGNFVVIQGKG